MLWRSSAILIFLLAMATALAATTEAVDFAAVELHQRPTRGGVEKGIPGLSARLKPNSAVKYFVAVFGKKLMRGQAPTHVIVAGHGSHAGVLFQNSAASRARKYAEVFPAHQILLLAVNELDGMDNAELLKRWGFRVLASRERELDVEMLMFELQSTNPIASFDLYAHSNEINGAALAEGQYFNFDNPDLRPLRSRFQAKAWASLHGCNSGFQLAPGLARLWQVPVAGSLTATHFQHLHSRGKFYPYDELMAPPGPFAAINALSFAKPQDCAGSGCERMHPDPYPYYGQWGRADHGLGFYRFFCGPVKAADCEARMALSLMGYIGRVPLNMDSPLQDFKSVLNDYMCPIHKDKSVFEACEQGIERALAQGDDTYTPFLGVSSVCDAKGCRKPSENEKSTEFMRAYKAFLRGYERRR